MNRTVARFGRGMALVMLLMAAVPPAAMGGIPEPSITLYGKVLNDTGALVTSGELVWSYAPPLGGDPVRISTNLRAVFAEGGPFSYVVELPAERPVAGFPITEDTLQLEAEPIAYTRSATVENIEAQIDAPTMVNLSIADRGAVDQVDLTVAGIVVEAPGEPSNPAPLNNAVGQPIQLTLSWASDLSVTAYELYFWESTEPTPNTPRASNLIVSQYTFAGLLNLDTTYHWQVVAKNTVGSTIGPVWTFSTHSSTGEGEGEGETEYTWGDLAGGGTGGTQTIDCNGASGGQDAALVLQWYAGLVDTLISCPGEIAYVAPDFPSGADVNADGVLGGQDASDILKFYAGIISCFSADPNCDGTGPGKEDLLAAKAGLPYRLLAMPADFPLPPPGREMRIPVFIDDAASVTSFRIEAAYPPDQVALERVQGGAMAAGWGALTVKAEEGYITVVNAGKSALDGGGELVRLVFRVLPGATGGRMSFGAKTELNDGHIAVGLVDGSFGASTGLAFVKQPPAFIWAQVDYPFSLTVEVENATGAVHYQWYKEGAGKAFVPVGDDATALSFDAIEYTDSGTYYCEATDDLAQIQSNHCVLEVVDELPVAGLLGLATLAAICGCLGAAVLVRRRPAGKRTKGMERT